MGARPYRTQPRRRTSRLVGPDAQYCLDVPRKTDTRERLLDAAIQSIEYGGEAAVRVNDLAVAVGVTKPSIYHFFGDREGLVAAALGEMYRRSLVLFNQFLLESARAARTRADYAALLEQATRSVGGDEGARRRALRAKVMGAAVSRPQLQRAIVEANRQTADELAQFMQIGRDKGFVDSRFDNRTTSLLWIGFVASRHFAEIDEESDLDAWDDIAVDLVRHLVLGSAEPVRP